MNSTYSVKLSPQLEFMRKIKNLSKDDLKVLFDKLKEEEAPLGMIMAVSKEYTGRDA